jgi:two-component system phosphate regulon sensor histidine kinase PhoR
MNRAALRTVIILAVISVIGIIATQLYWVKKSLDLQDEQFNHRVKVALNGVSNRLIANSLANGSKNVELETINRVANNYYTVDFSAPVRTRNLEEYLITEFRNQSLNEPFEYALFDCANDSLLFGKFIPDYNNITIERLNIKPNRDQNYYIGILFPRKQSYLIDDWTILAMFSVVIIIVLWFFSYTIITMLKQKQVSEIKNDFVNNMTHEFKTPIATIGLASDVLMKEDIIKNPAKLRHYARIISEENKRLKSQVETVLQVALTDAGKVQLKLERIDIHELITQSVDQIAVRVHEKGGTIVNKLSAHHHYVEGDRVHLSNILHNLLDNAIKYCDKIPEIVVATRNRGSYIEISIQDNGKGISSENINLIFEKFYRVHSGNVHDVKGFGIGLFYVKNMIKMHKGNISVKSKIGTGTTFYIVLPVKK